ncbi:hypothetical protein BVY01_02315 [bacterium I07]|nr:hypothetical protein BVY01_02315 [bacterium I07]
MINKVISHFKILEKLGEGGMGVVYKAHDTKLNRIVALKFLPPELTRDPEAKERFIHEARAASALCHNNICTIHEVDETEEGHVFICMDHYEGMTLKDKIKERPLKLEEAIDIAIQISKGLAEAHKAGIIHRDIKPANIIITKDNEVKILDFGLAKLTGQTKLTKVGTTLGTAAYMSPEQLKGNPVDHRTDIWALGVMMYEMLTGQLPFKGDYEQAITYAILNEDPEPITALRTGIPVALEGIVLKLMAKDPKHRYQHVDEVPVDLGNVDISQTNKLKEHKQNLGDLSSSRKSVRLSQIIPWVGMVLMLVIALIAYIKSRRHPNSLIKRVHIDLLDEAPLEPIGNVPFMRAQPALAISPDGSKLVYVAGISEGQTQLYLRYMDKWEIIPLKDTQGAYCPFFSPDGEWVGFFADNKLKKVSIEDGTVRQLCEAKSAVGASWGVHDDIIFSQDEILTLTWITAEGSLIKHLKIENYWPHFLPDGKTVIATSMYPFGLKTISLETGEEKLFREGNYSHPRYLRTGHLLYERNGILEVVPFDAKNVSITGNPVPVTDEIRIERNLRAVQCDVSRNGTLVYLKGSHVGLGQLTFVNRAGEEDVLAFGPKEYYEFQISPNGRLLAVTVREVNGIHLYKYDLDRIIESKIDNQGDIYTPVWTPDGQWITYECYEEEKFNTYMKRVLGGDEKKLLIKQEYKWKRPSSWSKDGKLLALEGDYYGRIGSEIIIYEKDRPDSLRAFTNTEFDEMLGVFSPDRKWLGYLSLREGEMNTFIKPYPGPGDEMRVSPDRGSEPIWSPTTNEIFYFTWGMNTLKYMVVPYKNESDFYLGEPKLLFEGDYVELVGRNWDVHPDGQRILLIKPVEETKPYRQINVVYNWFNEIKSKFEAEN